MANCLMIGDVRVEVERGRVEVIKNALVIQCSSVEELRLAISERRVGDFSLFCPQHGPPSRRSPRAGEGEIDSEGKGAL